VNQDDAKIAADMQLLDGLPSVREEQEQRTRQHRKADFDETVARLEVLAANDPREFDRQRRAEAKRLGVRSVVLDRAIADREQNHDAAKVAACKALASGLPVIYVDRGQLRDKVAQALDAMQQRNNPPAFFSRGGILVRLQEETHELEALDNNSLLAELTEAADWLKHTKNGEADADPPANVISAILGARRLPLPRIDSVARAPFFSREGKLVVQPGYHPDARVYLTLDAPLASELSNQPYPETPTAADVTWARSMLDELFCDFPFADVASNAHAKALTLLPFIRLMIDGPTPNHAVNAPMRGEGTGKGLLIQTACVPALGEVDASPETREDEEMRKVLGAAVLENAPIVWFDNVRGEVKSGVLAAVLTARNWIDRILGKSKRFRGCVLTTWCLAGNGLRFSREIARRTTMIKLDANMPHAWKRTGFRHDLPTWALANRAILIRACIILVQNWIARGRPAGSRVLGSYENWARVMGGILDAAGIEGFLENRDEESAETDREAQRWNPFIERWWRTYQGRAVTAKDLLQFAGDVLPDEGEERSRLTRLGALLTQRVDATYEIDSNTTCYLKIVRAEVERRAGGDHRGYALQAVLKTLIKVGEVGGEAKNPKKPTETKENLPANLDSEGGGGFEEVGRPQVLEKKGEFQDPPTSPTLREVFAGRKNEEEVF
jgi:hypothetical protein